MGEFHPKNGRRLFSRPRWLYHDGVAPTTPRPRVNLHILEAEYGPAFAAAAHGLFVLGGLLLYVLTTRAGRQRRHPSAALAWVLTIVLLPYLGVPLFLMFGTRKLAKPGAPRALPRASADDAGPRWAGTLLAGLGVAPALHSEAVRFHADGSAAQRTDRDDRRRTPSHPAGDLHPGRRSHRQRRRRGTRAPRRRRHRRLRPARTPVQATLQQVAAGHAARRRHRRALGQCEPARPDRNAPEPALPPQDAGLRPGHAVVRGPQYRGRIFHQRCGRRALGRLEL
jgi:hypothetical protein